MPDKWISFINYDERIQCAQEAMLFGDTPDNRLEGFISKIEDVHRLMNVLEVST